MKTSPQGKAFMQSWEKCSLKMYPDEGLRPTIGWGHLIKPGEQFLIGITVQEADALFEHDISGAEAEVSGLGEITQAQFDACVSLCYNIGVENFRGSRLVKFVRSGDSAQAADEFLRWKFIHGKPSNGLIARRAAEREIFLNGNYVNHI